MSVVNVKESAHRLLQKSHDACDHIWNAHRQCQWCHRDQRDIDAELVASAYLSVLTSLETQKLLLAEMKKVNAPRQTLELLVRLGFEMECLSTGRCCELLGENVVDFRERGWVQSRIYDCLVSGMNRVGEHTSYGKEVALILKDFE